MPRLFWKLFFALWLSIMTFAVVVSWINQVVVMQNTGAESAEPFEAKLARVRAKLTRDLENGGERKVVQTLRELPRGIRDHVYVIDPQNKELLGREKALKKQRRSRSRANTRKLQDANGAVYRLVSIGRAPPRRLLAPGSMGVGMRLVVAAMVSAVLSLLLARYLAAPLGQLSLASRRLATGDLTTRVGAPLDQRKDEFGQLAMDLDEMAHRLQLYQQSNQRLLRDVSHELRSPLARLRVALEIARNKDQSRVVEELNRIELESERLETLVDEVLGLLRESTGSQSLQLVKFDLCELLQDLVTTVNYETGETDQTIELELAPTLMLNADRELLWRAFENLLRNALVHAGGYGGIQVAASQTSENEIQVAVRDAGPGIAEHHIERVFEPFYRVDEARNRKTGGHGLGLAIAASAVRRHGGRISAANRTGGGLEILVTLPCA